MAVSDDVTKACLTLTDRSLRNLIKKVLLHAGVCTDWTTEEIKQHLTFHFEDHNVYDSWPPKSSKGMQGLAGTQTLFIGSKFEAVPGKAGPKKPMPEIFAPDLVAGSSVPTFCGTTIASGSSHARWWPS